MDIFKNDLHEMDKHFALKLIKTSDAIVKDSFLSGLSLLQHPKTVQQLRKGGPDLDCLHVAIFLDLFRIDLQNLLFSCLQSKTKTKQTSFSKWWLPSSEEAMTEVAALVKVLSGTLQDIWPRRKCMKVWDALYDYPKTHHLYPRTVTCDTH